MKYAPRHVVAPFLEFHEIPAAEAALPALVLGLLQDLARLLVAGALAALVPLAVAGAADAGVAAGALGVLAAAAAAARLVDPRRPDPGAAVLLGAVEPVARRVLGELAVPVALEVVVEQPLYVLQRDVVRRAALGRHL